MEGLSDVELSVNVEWFTFNAFQAERNNTCKGTQHENSICGQENHKVPQLE